MLVKANLKNNNESAGAEPGQHRATPRLDPRLGRGSRSGFRPMGFLEGATGLPAGLHLDKVARRKKAGCCNAFVRPSLLAETVWEIEMRRE